jgi:uncharacterized protein (TIGR03437 family)
MSVTVTNGNVTSAALTATANPLSPAFFLWPSNQAVATHTDGTFAVKNGTFSGVATVPAKPGEFVVVWGTGFGPTSPAAPLGTQTPAGQIYSTSNAVSATVNGAPAAVYLNVASLAPGFAGLYQVAIQVPANAPDGDLPLVASVGGVQSPTGVTISVQH